MRLKSSPERCLLNRISRRFKIYLLIQKVADKTGENRGADQDSGEFTLELGRCWGAGQFVLNFVNFQVVPGDNLPPDVLQLEVNTIEILKLNDDDLFVNIRFQAIRDYALGQTTLGFLASHYPFIYYELLRQGLAEEMKNRFN